MRFHNFQHGLSTLHYTFKMIQVAQLYKRLNHAEMFAMILAALCHDVDHRGYNNAFEIMTRSELASDPKGFHDISWHFAGFLRSFMAFGRFLIRFHRRLFMSEAPLQRQFAPGEPSLCQASLTSKFDIDESMSRTFELALNSEDCNFFQARFSVKWSCF